MIKILLTIMLLLPLTAYADTLLMGFDSTLMPPSCFQSGQNLVNHSFKAFRWPASASGTINYFKLRQIATTNATADELIWAIYSDNNGSVGALKAYGYYPNYNWVAKGIGAHTFPITTTVTNASITQGVYYWLVVYSTGMDGAWYQEVASAPIPTERGNGECAPGITMISTGQNAHTNLTAPPTPGEYSVPVQSYHAWSVWSSDASPPPPPPPPPPPQDTLSPSAPSRVR